MTNANELKQIFREGWTNPSVVAHRVERFIDGEFGFEPSRKAWREALQQAASIGAVTRACDMGTGPGTIAQLWAELGFEVTGVDFSAPMLEAGRQNTQRRNLQVEFIEADVEEPPFSPASFDLISSRAVLFTLPHPGYTVARWVKLLKPGGILVLIGENNPTDPEKLQRQHRPAPGWKPDERYLAAMNELPFKNHTGEMVRVVMEAAGLHEIQSIPMQDVINARHQHEALEPAQGVLQGTPYVLVGRKAPHHGDA